MEISNPTTSRECQRLYPHDALIICFANFSKNSSIFKTFVYFFKFPEHVYFDRMLFFSEIFVNLFTIICKQFVDGFIFLSSGKAIVMRYELISNRQNKQDFQTSKTSEN